jgi:hypothetical protein
MWELVDHFYITTYEGSPRIESCKKEISHWNIPPEKLTWNIPKKLEIDNCPMSSASKNHCDAYRDAYKNGYKNIIVLEDDFLVYDHSDTIPEINNKTNYFIENYPDYDLLYYGYFPWKIDSNFNDNGIIKMYGLLQHAYLISDRFYSLFIDLDPIKSVNMCCPLMKMSIDFWAFNLQVNKRFSSYGVYPQLVYQDNIPLPIFKKGNTRKELFKLICDYTTELTYNKDVVSVCVIIFIIVLLIGKKIC